LISRRSIERGAGTLVLAALFLVFAGFPEPRGIVDRPVTGTSEPALRSFDELVPRFLHKWSVPGASVALVKDGRLILARGYGWADEQRRHPVEPTSLFRIASVSKPITSAAILRLVEDGKLSLEDRAFDHVPAFRRFRTIVHDGRLDQITIRELLEHAGGWDRQKAFDPMFKSREIAASLGMPSPASAEAVVRYMLQKPLQFDPGTRYAYSNFGYAVLGRVIEEVTGQPYGEWVRTHVLAPAGVCCMALGHSLRGEQRPEEVEYASAPGAGLAPSVFPSGPRQVPWPYGGWSIEAMDSHGGWVASAIDLVRFVNALDGRGGVRPLLRAETVRVMTDRPPPPLWVGADHWYGLGWDVRPTPDGGRNWWHTGSLDGTSTLLVRASNGLTWAVLLNSRPRDAQSDAFTGELDSMIWKAVDGVRSWPTGDLFPRYTPKL
jgi:CubicO group peptidase (beta-lactamase class C family)